MLRSDLVNDNASMQIVNVTVEGFDGSARGAELRLFLWMLLEISVVCIDRLSRCALRGSLPTFFSNSCEQHSVNPNGFAYLVGFEFLRARVCSRAATLFPMPISLFYL